MQAWVWGELARPVLPNILLFNSPFWRCLNSHNNYPVCQEKGRATANLRKFLHMGLVQGLEGDAHSPGCPLPSHTVSIK